ncbi:nickel-type superoxide dismutase maturation protease [Streptomyces sp. NPDC002889]|uniref:nickel-type superoxide dismutase maturation protease n=1 Tax=Streptomyces sp. NPDC002889 TaxID=3364669 RepID=UPI0036A7094E
MAEQGREPTGLFGLVEATGRSMYPRLRHRDQLLVHYGAELRAGDVALLRHPLQQDLLIVKRLVGRRDGGWWVLGDNQDDEVVDSRSFGAVPDELVLARVRARYRPMLPGRRRTPAYVASWVLSAVRLVLADRSVSRRLRAR